MEHSRSTWAAAVALLCVSGLCASVVWLPGCGGDAGDTAPPEEPAPAWPEGTVLVTQGQSITAEEIERYVDLISMVEPEFVRDDHRRKALANISIPILAARALFPEKRLEAFQQAQSYLSHSRETGDFPPGVKPRYATGTWYDVGMVEWDAARATALNDFSGLVETPGGWAYMKVIAKGVPEGVPFEATTQVTVQIVEVPFIETPDRRELLESAVDQFVFEVVDPAWEPLVPPFYLTPKKPYEERYK